MSVFYSVLFLHFPDSSCSIMICSRFTISRSLFVSSSRRALCTLYRDRSKRYRIAPELIDPSFIIYIALPPTVFRNTPFQADMPPDTPWSHHLVTAAAVLPSFYSFKLVANCKVDWATLVGLAIEAACFKSSILNIIYLPSTALE